MNDVRRYDLVARAYDVLSLERLLYGRPRARTLELLGPPVGGTVLDLGCGTGLNFPRLVTAVGPTGRVIGIDSSAPMLAAAARRITAGGWSNIALVAGDVTALSTLLDAAGLAVDAVDAVVATFVLSLLDDPTGIWADLDEAVRRHPVRIAVADIGTPDTALRPLRPVYALLARAGGAQPQRRSWRPLLQRDPGASIERMYGGHVRIAAATLVNPR